MIDTNVLVSGLISSHGAPMRIVDLMLAGVVVPIVSEAILAEYEEVLSRPELSLPERDVRSVLAYLRLPGSHIVHVDPVKTERVCTDRTDDIFTAAASEGTADYLITGNPRHFPGSPWRSIRIVTPTRFLELARLTE